MFRIIILKNKKWSNYEHIHMKNIYIKSKSEIKLTSVGQSDLLLGAVSVGSSMVGVVGGV